MDSEEEEEGRYGKPYGRNEKRPDDAEDVLKNLSYAVAEAEAFTYNVVEVHRYV